MPHSVPGQSKLKTILALLLARSKMKSTGLEDISTELASATGIIFAGTNGSESGQEGEEAKWKRQTGARDAHHGARAVGQSNGNDVQDSKKENEDQELLKRYSPQEIALLRALQHEKKYRQGLRANDGKRKSPQTHNRSTIAIDVADQFTPDNWLPRSGHLIRLTSNHPLNAEPELSLLYQAGLITPNELHCVRNHGAVPRLYWNTHKLDIEDGKLVLSMSDWTKRFESINIPVCIACDGNRRKEMNLVRKSKGFNWSVGAGGCAYRKGVPLCDVLAAAGVRADGQRWVNFEGADEPSEGKYATFIPLAYAMDRTNDVLLAYEMNDLPLPPDHGYPLRLVIPGYIWVSETENTSHYHIWDNRVLPSFITEKDSSFAETMFSHPDTACNEQNLNSVIVKPSQGERLSLAQAKVGQSYRIEGYAYDGGGKEVEHVEKFWIWLSWHVDVSIVHLLQAKTITVRAWNVFKNTQPEHLNWNIMGMMNNCWYKVKTGIDCTDGAGPFVLFRHPCEPTGNGGWMKTSVENQIQSAKQEAGAPTKQFTRQEVEKHDKEDDCWLVVDGKVYDATSVLCWHPGGKASILGRAGRVHHDTTDQFAAIHDDFAYKNLHECALGVVTEKAANFIKAEAEETREQEGEGEICRRSRGVAEEAVGASDSNG
ncbi:uncharacterized protein LTR77_002387 [Saxophila tyrrhenica]|uniref:Nitrate reductase [NADPH] n=1 Tax=Saxophila tyrrhenica TaxID=1690608 RepID=A0AAV9PK70_9PEZI|nr:hypothetical protein LTR77_002387 [Saxophila tyrrhenica]